MLRRKLNRTQEGPERQVFQAIGEADQSVSNIIRLLRGVSREEGLSPTKVREMERKLHAIRRMLEDLPLLTPRYNETDVNRKAESDKRKKRPYQDD